MRAIRTRFMVAPAIVSGAVSFGAFAGTWAPGFQPGSATKWPASLVTFVQGDANDDDTVTFDDVTAVLGSWNPESARGSGDGSALSLVNNAHHFGDATGDGFVTDLDITAVLANFGAIGASGSASLPPFFQPEQRSDTPTPRAIAAWDAVPDAEFRGSHPIGVVAFHIGGISHVEFTVNGNAIFRVGEMSRNPVTGVNEYTLTLDGSKLPRGVVEVRAAAVPYWGESRDLGALRLLNRTGEDPGPAFFVRGFETGGEEPIDDGSEDSRAQPRGDGSLEDPFERIYDAAVAAVRNGRGTVYLLPGDHLWAGRKGGEVSVSLPSDFGWLTVAAAPGSGPSDVRIIGNSSGTGGINAQRVRLRDVSVIGTSLDTNRTSAPAIWFERCVLTGTHRDDNSTQFANGSSWTGGIYATDTVVTDVRTATKHWDLVRGCRFERIGSDVFHNPSVVIDCEAHDVRKNGGGAHPDLIQFNGDFENVIIYGLKATEVWAQGIFSRGSSGIPDRDMAFVNIEIDAKNYLSQWLQSADHLLFWNVSFLGRALNISNDPGRGPTVLRHLSVRECVIEDLRLDPTIPEAETQVWLGNAIGQQRQAITPEAEWLGEAGTEE